MPKLRFTTPGQPRPVLEYGRCRFQAAARILKWTAFMALLWSGFRPTDAGTPLRRAACGAAVALALVTLPACSELAQSGESTPPEAKPPYAALAAKHLQSMLKDRAAYDDFEISGLRWIHSVKGWDWLACVHFHERGHLRTYALFISNDAIVDSRYAVETDACEPQTYTPFDLVTGVLGRPTAPVQPAFY
jgi:hypothetical protein